MAVTFTPNVGLAKVTESEFAKNWARFTNLADDNNVILETQTNIPITGYTPVLTANTTPPNLGTGSISGKFQEAGGFVWGTFFVLFLDTGITAGNGEYAISLPQVADGAFHAVGTAFTTAPGVFSCIGEGYISDNSTVANNGTVALDVVTVAGVSYARLVTEQFVGKTSRLMRDGMPFTVAHSDNITGNYFYKKQ